MNETEEFLREHGHIPTHVNILPDYQAPEKSYVISDETLHELMRVFAEQYAQQRERKKFIEIINLLDEHPGKDKTEAEILVAIDKRDWGALFDFLNHQNQQ
jgi:hypothetical protein